MFKRIGLLWAKRDKNDRQYLDGFIEGGPHLTRSKHKKIKVVLYANESKLTEASPDYYLYIAIKDKKEATDGGAGGKGSQRDRG